MRVISPRFSVRSILLIVALIAVALGIERTFQRLANNRLLARHHAESEENSFSTGRQCLDNVVEYERRRLRYVSVGDARNAQVCVENSAPFASEADRLFRQAEHHAQLRRFYASRW
jgi:hypothetical protein